MKKQEDYEMTEIRLSQNTFWNDLRTGKFARMIREESKGQSLNNAQEAYHVLKPLFATTDDVERLYCIFLNTQNRILGIEKMFTGTLTQAAVYPREIVKKIISFRAAALIMGHNHLSGSTKPSPEDRQITKKVALAIYSIDVQFLDHIIIGNGFFSFSDQGIMAEIKRKIEGFYSDN